MKDPAGLQATLRADGIPARVTFDPSRSTTQPLPAGCAAPRMSDSANAQLQGRILTPPAIEAYLQQEWQRAAQEPLHITYTVNGQVNHETVRNGSDWQGKLREEHATDIIVNTAGDTSPLPGPLQKLQEKEEQDPSGRFALYIYPPAIPAGIGLSIGVDAASLSSFSFGEDLVVTSPQCTGS
jgi:DNA-binding transcriptional regulator YdaS (Cro superfamily)